MNGYAKPWRSGPNGFRTTTKYSQSSESKCCGHSGTAIKGTEHEYRLTHCDVLKRNAI